MKTYQILHLGLTLRNLVNKNQTKNIWRNFASKKAKGYQKTINIVNDTKKIEND